MSYSGPCFRDGTPMKKWQREFASHVYKYGFTKDQARQAISMNPYLAKHSDYDRVFDELPNIFATKENKWALDNYAEWLSFQK